MKTKLMILILLFTVTAASAQKKRKTTTTTTTTVVTEAAPVVYWPLVWVNNVDMNVKYDTTLCGYVTFKWDAQPNFSTTKDTQYTNLGLYYLYSKPLTYTFQYPCGGMNSPTNSYYYTLNSGCSFTGNHSYELTITYYWKDDANQRIVGYTSKPIVVTTGRNQWECK